MVLQELSGQGAGMELEDCCGWHMRLHLFPSACPAVEKPTQGVAAVAPSCSIYSDTAVSDAAFRDFQSILLGYSDVFLKSKVLNI